MSTGDKHRTKTETLLEVQAEELQADEVQAEEQDKVPDASGAESDRLEMLAALEDRHAEDVAADRAASVSLIELAEVLDEHKLWVESGGDAGAKALGESAYLRGLLVLRLGDNPISKSSAAALAGSPLGKRLAVMEWETSPSAPPFMN